MNRVLFSNWVVIPLRVLLGAIFAYAGILKILQPAPFADSIASFQLLPDVLVNVIAIGLPPVEIAAGLMMVFGWNYRPASLLILGLTIVFTIALAQGLVRGLNIDCGCFGSHKPSVVHTWLSFGRDILLIAASALIYASGSNWRERAEDQEAASLAATEIEGEPT